MLKSCWDSIHLARYIDCSSEEICVPASHLPAERHRVTTSCTQLVEKSFAAEKSDNQCFC